MDEEMIDTSKRQVCAKEAHAVNEQFLKKFSQLMQDPTN